MNKIFGIVATATLTWAQRDKIPDLDVKVWANGTVSWEDRSAQKALNATSFWQVGGINNAVINTVMAAKGEKQKICSGYSFGGLEESFWNQTTGGYNLYNEDLTWCCYDCSCADISDRAPCTTGNTQYNNSTAITNSTSPSSIMKQRIADVTTVAIGSYKNSMRSKKARGVKQTQCQGYLWGGSEDPRWNRESFSYERLHENLTWCCYDCDCDDYEARYACDDTSNMSQSNITANTAPHLGADIKKEIVEFQRVCSGYYEGGKNNVEGIVKTNNHGQDFQQLFEPNLEWCCWSCNCYDIRDRQACIAPKKQLTTNTFEDNNSWASWHSKYDQQDTMENDLTTNITAEGWENPTASLSQCQNNPGRVFDFECGKSYCRSHRDFFRQKCIQKYPNHVTSGTFVTNEGKSFQAQTPFKVNSNLFVFGGYDGGWFKMAGVANNGTVLENRYTNGHSCSTITDLTLASWNTANINTLGSYSVTSVKTAGSQEQKQCSSDVDKFNDTCFQALADKDRLIDYYTNTTHAANQTMVSYQSSGENSATSSSTTSNQGATALFTGASMIIASVYFI